MVLNDQLYLSGLLSLNYHDKISQKQEKKWNETYTFLLSFPEKRQYTYSNMLKKGTGLIPTKVTRKYSVTSYRYKVI